MATDRFSRVCCLRVPSSHWMIQLTVCGAWETRPRKAQRTTFSLYDAYLLFAYFYGFSHVSTTGLEAENLKPHPGCSFRDPPIRPKRVQDLISFQLVCRTALEVLHCFWNWLSGETVRNFNTLSSQMFTFWTSFKEQNYLTININ